MSNRFIKFIPSKESDYLQENHPNAFLLLCLIAKRARRIAGEPDGLEIAESHIGDYKKAGIESERKYRTAKKILEDRKHIKICETCRNRKKSTTKVTTIGTLVKILRSDVWDINPESIDDRIDDRPTTDRRRTRMNKKEKESHHHLNPSSSNGLVQDDESDGLTDFSLISENQECTENRNIIVNIGPSPEESKRMPLMLGQKKKESPIQSGPLIEIYRDEKGKLPTQSITQSDLDLCIKILKEKYGRGSLEDVKHVAKYAMESPDRKWKIKNWPQAMNSWDVKFDIKPKLKENEEWARKQVELYAYHPGWHFEMYRHPEKDQVGVLVYNPSSAGNAKPEFVACIEPDFRDKLNKLLREKKMQKGRVAV